jgi:hypothetical protein
MFNLSYNCQVDFIPNTDSIQQPLAFLDSSDSKFITFNPNNPDEILYYSKFSKALLIFNRANFTKKVFKYLEQMSYPPRWSINNEIIFQNNIDGKITIFNEIGEVKKVIGLGLVADFSNDGNKVIYQSYINSLGGYRGIVYNALNNKYDTLKEQLNVSLVWGFNSHLICYLTYEQTKTGVNIFDVNNKRNTLIQNIDINKISPNSFNWISETEYFYTQGGKLYIYNIINLELKVIGEVCAGEYISWSSYCPKSKELITTLSHWTTINKDLVKITSRVLILNFGTGKISYIVL